MLSYSFHFCFIICVEALWLGAYKFRIVISSQGSFLSYHYALIFFIAFFLVLKLILFKTNIATQLSFYEYFPDISFFPFLITFTFFVTLCFISHWKFLIIFLKKEKLLEISFHSVTTLNWYGGKILYILLPFTLYKQLGYTILS